MRPALIQPAAALVAAAALLSTAAQASSDFDERAGRLSALRSEVAEIQERLTERREALDVSLRALNAHRVDLDVQVRREELRVEQMRLDLARILEETARDAGLEEAVGPAVHEAIASLRALVEEGLPFRVAERVQALDELDAQVRDGVLPPTKAVGRLWAFAEDELRLRRENVLDRQVVSLPGGDVLADVVRLGMVTLYFRAGDGRVGHAVRDGQAWRWETIDGAASVRRVEELFEAVAKGIRVGWFELPWAFGEVPR